jgi:hypothetical protein
VLGFASSPITRRSPQLERLGYPISGASVARSLALRSIKGLSLGIDFGAAS